MKQYLIPTVFPMRSPAQMLILIRLPPKGYFLFILGSPAVSCNEMEFEYGIKIIRKKNVKSNKRPLGLIDHLSYCSVALTMYIYVHYNHKANELLSKFYNNYLKICTIRYINILEQILSTKKIIGRNYTILPYIIIYLCPNTRIPYPRVMNFTNLEESLFLTITMYIIYWINTLEQRRGFSKNY